MLYKESKPSNLVEALDKTLSSNVELDDTISEAIRLIPEEYKEMSLKQLHDICKPQEIDYEIKIAIWDKIMRGRKLTCSTLAYGLCSCSFLKRYIFKQPAKVAWLFYPTPDYDQRIEALLNVAYDRYMDLINVDISDAAGANTLLKVIQNLENRVRGSIVQRSEVKNLSLRANVNQLENKSVDDINARLKELEHLLPPTTPPKEEE